jgi:hypothetical protein
MFDQTVIGLFNDAVQTKKVVQYQMNQATGHSQLYYYSALRIH